MQFHVQSCDQIKLHDLLQYLILFHSPSPLFLKKPNKMLNQNHIDALLVHVVLAQVIFDHQNQSYVCNLLQVQEIVLSYQSLIPYWY